MVPPGKKQMDSAYKSILGCLVMGMMRCLACADTVGECPLLQALAAVEPRETEERKAGVCVFHCIYSWRVSILLEVHHTRK